jgi:hypothetical protein
MKFSPPSIPSHSFCESSPEVKRVLDSNVMVAKGTSLNDVWSSASVTRKAARTLASSRREARTLGVTSWRKRISGDFDSSRIWLRMSLARETGRGEKASMFHDMRESPCVQEVSMLRNVGENLCVTWLCTFRKGMGSQLRVDRLKAERVRQSLLVTMAVRKREASGRGLSPAEV